MATKTGMTKNKTADAWRWAIFLLLPIFIYIAVVSFLTPLMEDEFGIRGKGQVLFAFQEAWQFYKDIYFTWGGRIGYLLHPFFFFSFYRAPFEEGFSQIVLAILNGLAVVGFLLALFFLAFARKPLFNDKKDRVRIFVIFMLMMTMLVEKGETIFWSNGRHIYLWSVTILAWFAVFYRLVFAHHATDHWLKFNNHSRNHFFFTVAMAPLAVVAGMTDYIGVVIVLGLIALGFIHNIFFSKQKLPLWCYVIFIFFIVGFIAMVTAPGNHVRLLTGEFAVYRALPLFQKVFYHPLVGFRTFLHETLFLPIIIWPVLYYWQSQIVAKGKNPMRRMIKKMQQDKNFAMAVIYTLASFGFVAFMAINPSSYSRTWFAATALFLLTCILVIDFFLLSPVVKNIFIKKYIFYIPVMIFALYLSHIMIITIGFHQEFKTRVATIVAQKNQGKATVIIKPYSTNYIYSRWGARGGSFWNWESQTSPWVLGAMANYYGVKKIVIEK